MKKFWSNASSGERIFFVILILFFLLVFLSEYINDRFWLNDFRVYYDATKAMLQGDAVYNEAFGLSSGMYKYAPIALLPFIPLSFLSYEYASIVFYILLSGCYLTAVFYIPKRINTLLNFEEGSKRFWTFSFFTFLIIASHCHRELHLGNINIILLVLAFTAFYSYHKGAYILSSILIGTVILFKPHFVVLLLLLVLWRKWKMLGVAALFLVVGLFIPIIWLGVDGNASMLSEWGGTMVGHSANLEGSVNTIYYYPVKIYNEINGGDAAGLIALIAVLIAGVLAFLVHFKLYSKVENRMEKDRLFMFEFFVLLAIIPSLSVTDTEHFVLALPLVVYSLFMFRKSTSTFIKVIFIIACFFYGGDWGDLMGEFNQIMGKYGLIGLGNVLIIITSVHFYLVHKNLKAEKN